MRFQAQNFLRKRQKGQILVLVGLIFIALVAFVGLVIDLGMVFVNYSRLRRAVDAAALAATGEFKRGYATADLQNAARQLLTLNQVTLGNSDVIAIDTCRTKPGDAQLCTTPPRKVVKIVVTQRVPLYFMSVLGMNTFPITVEAISEASRVDVMLVSDRSGSMSADPLPATSPDRDPKICNESDPNGTSYATPGYDKTPGPDGLPGECHPFEEMKAAALGFLDQLDSDYDRMGVVVFDRFPHIGEAISGGVEHYPGLPLSSDYYTIVDAIKHLELYEGLPGGCPFYSYNAPTTNQDLEICRLYRDETKAEYEGLFGVSSIFSPPGNPGENNTTNLGSAIAMGANALAGVYPAGVPFTPAPHEDALWAMIVLSDFNANAGRDDENKPICPSYTWTRKPKCRDRDSNERHDKSQTSLYDADDYARDMIDYAAGNNAVIFAIGLGLKTLEPDPGSTAPPPGEALMNYAAEAGHGVAYYAPGGSELSAIFLAIANNIATRLTQ